TDREPAECVALQHVDEGGDAREPEKRLTTAFLVQPVLRAAAVGRAQRDAPVGPDGLVDVQADGIALESVQEADRAFLPKVVAARKESRGTETARHIQTVVQEWLRLNDLCDRVVTDTTGPWIQLLTLAQNRSRYRRSRIHRE